MSTKQKFLCTQEQFESIHEVIDQTRESNEFVRKIPRQALANLLIDHANLMALYYKDTGDKQ